MWRFVILTCITIPGITAQHPRNQRPFDNSYGWDIRLAVPGQPGNDYPTLDSIPKTSFTCSGKDPGYYADVETNCQVFRVCTLGSTYGFQSFICPNGTLFNQAVLVCDWWMKVNCKKSRELLKNKNENFEKLKLGAKFMTDIKQMITHPMRNPYDDKYIKHNLIVMQEYKPPPNQLYNGPTLNNLNSAYLQTVQPYKNNFQNGVPYPTHVAMSSIPSTPNTQNDRFVQSQKQSKSYLLPNQVSNLNNLQNGFILNSRTGKTSQTKNLDVIKYSQNTHSVRPTQIYQRSIQKTQSNQYKPQEKSNENIGSTYLKSQQTFNNSNLSKNKQIELGIEFSKQQLNRKINQAKNYSDKNLQARYFNFGPTGNKTKQNTVSSDTPPEIITKTLAFRRIIKDSSNGNPKSRITFKTWIVRPSRNSKLVAEPTPYTYNRPSIFLNKVIQEIDDNTNQNVSTPKVETETVASSYAYKAPIVKISDRILTTSTEIPDTEIISSTTSPEIFTGYALPAPSPTKPALLYLVPTTFKPSSRQYLPPLEKDKQISNQYLLPIIKNSKLVAAASSPRPFLAVNEGKPSFFLSKRTHINTNHNNLAFSDILTKENLDISVNNIVKDTNNVLQEVSRKEFTNLNNNVQSFNYPIDNSLYYDSASQSDEKLTLQTPTPLSKNSRLIAIPSINLEPPTESTESINPNNNQISSLPYFEESTKRPNTIERTVSLKITIPENIANLLFKNGNTSYSENLELLSTGDSNNLVLSNRVAEDADGSIIPVGKLTWNKNSNISNSQDLVFSLLVDSINAAKEYNNIVQHNVATSQPTPTQPQFQNVNNDELQRISNDISQLTSSQFSAKNFSYDYKLAHLRTPPSSDSPALSIQYGVKNRNQNSPTQREQYKLPLQQNILKSNQNQTISQSFGNNELNDLNINSDKIYSGQLYQLPVPVVSKHIYNSLFPASNKLSTNDLQAKTRTENSYHRNSLNEKLIQKAKADFEYIEPHTLERNSFQPSFTGPKIIDQGISANGFIDTLDIPNNGITAQLRDNIVGTLPHPLNEDKQIKYKKDQTYYIYTHLNNEELSTDTQINNIQNIIGNNLASREFSPNDKLSRISAYELVPSLSYKLEDEREKQKLLRAFQINDYGIPKPKLSNEKYVNQQDVTSDVDFTIDHPRSANIEKPRFLYDGPSSYSAPQQSVGNLNPNQNNVQNALNFNSKIEKFDTEEDNNYGYPKITPVKRFLF